MMNMNSGIFINRRKKLEAQLLDRSLMFLFAGRVKQKSLDIDYPFCVNRNYYYMTGCDMPNQLLMIAKLNGLVKEWIFLIGPTLI